LFGNVRQRPSNIKVSLVNRALRRTFRFDAVRTHPRTAANFVAIFVGIAIRYPHLIIPPEIPYGQQCDTQ
jgi:hypothetical protein